LDSAGNLYIVDEFDNRVLKVTGVSSLPCSFSLPSSSQSFPIAGGLSSFIVSTAPGCGWNVNSSGDWITSLTGAAQGPGRVNFLVSANAETARTGTIAVGGLTYNVTQAGFTCTYTLGTSFASPSNSGGQVSVSVGAPVGCPWTAASNASWIDVLSGASGSGGGTVLLSVGAVTVARSGTVTIAGQTFTVNQGNQGVGACGAQDVTSQVSVSRSGLTPGEFGGGSPYWYQNLSVKNTSGAPIAGPVHLVFLGVPNHLASPYGDSVNFNSLTTCYSAKGDADLVISSGLQPGQTQSVSVTFFADSISASIQYTSKVLSGTPSH
jgi:hypothetical protein